MPFRTEAGEPRSVSSALFTAATFLSAFLLFLVEPIAAKQLLPRFGGSAGVWISCLVFFQCALLAGYGFADWLARGRNALQREGGAYPLVLGISVLSAAAWALHQSTSPALTAHPFFAISRDLLLTVGLPFLSLAATSPLLQAWFARANAGQTRYSLYGISNLASLLALGLYPTLMEPYLPMHTQRVAWVIGFTFFAVLAIRLQRALPQAAPATAVTSSEEPTETPAPSLNTARLLWLLLPMAASMQLAAITAHLTANVAAIPLLWILPLAVYLLSLVFSFQFPRLLPQGIILRLLAVMLASLGYLLSKVDVSVPIALAIAVYLAELFFAAQFCHAAAYELRPRRAEETTRFYLIFATGGALGAILIGVVFPLIFSANYDLAISFTVTAAVAAFALWQQGWSQRLLWLTGTALLLFLLGLQRIAYRQDTLFSERNFYGTLRVQQNTDSSGQTVRTLANGSIRHGTQIFTPELVRTPTTYYAYDSGVGLALRLCCGDSPRRIGVIGLGTGTVAAYGKPGDTLRFYDINPAVPPVARNLFAYLRQTPATTTIVEGDARASLTFEPPQNFNVLVVDAFSGDAIPLHLLTAEAMQVYLRHLAPGGILAFHVSNQHVDLEPAVQQLGEHNGLQASTVHNAADNSRGEFRSTWVLLTANQQFLAQPEVVQRSQPTQPRAGLRLWTDDYSSLFPLIR
ncbi:spermidine synthase [Terriglobus aquaticus]|uniref:Spermidine synthase n=1 Tax=Terriglobus aquaticus TaxID=940139 RepID=A0ABW9KHH2_9BACT|nr:fused MFS/spermidine synthase [Terriglobus aquaticus]